MEPKSCKPKTIFPVLTLGHSQLSGNCYNGVAKGIIAKGNDYLVNQRFLEVKRINYFSQLRFEPLFRNSGELSGKMNAWLVARRGDFGEK